MGYVFTEILPWILLALVVGFLLGLFFWWCRWWLVGAARQLAQLNEARGFATSQEQRAGELAFRLDARETELRALTSQLQTIENDATALTDEMDRLRAGIDGLEADRTSLTGQVEGLRADNGRLQARVADLEPLAREASRLRASLTDMEAVTTGLRARAEELERAGAPAAALGFAASPSLPAPDVAAGSATLGIAISLDDLTVVEGIGPKIAGLLRDAGIATWRALSTTEEPALRSILEAAGPRFQMHDPSTWPRQARLLAAGRWEEFKTLTDRLRGGREG